MSSAEAVPPGLERAVREALAGAEPADQGTRADVPEPLNFRAVSGGCIANALRVSAPGRSSAFLKWAPRGDPAAATFDAEAAGLEALAASGAVRVPGVLGRLEAEDGAGLLLEWLEPVRPGAGAWRALGRSLAALHGADPPLGGPGWSADNFIGTLPQSNEPASDWAEFWWARRLQPQIEMAGAALGALAPRLDHLCEALPDLLSGIGEDGLSLLHGDLWSGNVLFTDAADTGSAGDDCEGALIDPSVYVGHREVDLAMAELFGGFPPAFFEGYEGERPTLPGYADRRPVYQLYHLLVHVNLFGAGYLPGTARALEQIGA
ncbi:MAG: fructosamine kinase family protein [Gemmatimonadota bacterium]